LKAITIDAAYQYAEQESKGSLELGKLADFVAPSTRTLESGFERDQKMVRVAQQTL
jgi:predicted amidohydrolase YtcJ